MTLVYLGLGSNLGDRAGQLALARHLLEEAGLRLLRGSSVIESEPWGVSEQPRFLNQVLEAEWDGSPEELLGLVKNVEHRAGRRPRRRWGAREIDVDILLFGDQRIDRADLQVPHPRMAERDFVLGPLAELRPDLVHSRA